MFEMDNLSTWASNYSNLDFLRQWELGKFNQFLYYNKTKMIKMIWDTVYVWAKKVWTFKNGKQAVFETMRDPSKHTFVKLNAYGFNEAVLRQIKSYNPDSVIHVKQKGTKLVLWIWVWKALEIWQYLVFNWEKQVFIPKSEFNLGL